MTDGTMTVTEAANTLGLSRQLIHAWCKKGKLIATQGAGNRAAWRIDRASVESMQNSDDLARAHKHRALLVGRPKRRAYAGNMQGAGA